MNISNKSEQFEKANKGIKVLNEEGFKCKATTLNLLVEEHNYL